MDTPQILSIDRYVIETLLPDLVGHDRRASAFLVYMVILAAASEGRVALSHTQLAERAGLSRRSVQTAVEVLRRRQLIEVTRRAATDTSEYRPLSPWRRGEHRSDGPVLAPSVVDHAPTSPAPASPTPTMTPRQLKFFSEWYVVVAWPDGREQRVNGFDSEAHARGWIDQESEAWIANARRPSR